MLKGAVFITSLAVIMLLRLRKSFMLLLVTVAMLFSIAALTKHAISFDIDASNTDKHQSNRVGVASLSLSRLHLSQANPTVHTPRAMLLAYPRRWPTIHYIVGLAEAGFNVSVTGYLGDSPGRIASKADSVSCFHGCGDHATTACTMAALVNCQPDIVLPLSDAASEALIELQQSLHLMAAYTTAQQQHVASVLELSLPRQQHQAMILDKGRLVHELAEKTLKLRVPSRTVATIADLAHIAKTGATANGVKLPVVIKTSKGSGGQGVRIAHSQTQLRDGAQHIIDSLQLGVSESLIGRAHGDVAAYIEQFVEGDMAIIGVASYRGHLLSTVCSWAVTSSPTV